MSIQGLLYIYVSNYHFSLFLKNDNTLYDEQDLCICVQVFVHVCYNS